MNEYEQFLDRVETACDKLTLGVITYSEWSKILTGETLYADETLRRCHLFFDKFLNRLEEHKLNGVNEQDADRVKELQRLKAEIKAERIKLSDEKREQNTNDRRNARNELFSERVVQAIENLAPIRIAPCVLTEKPKVSGVLAISDLHFDSTYTLYGIYGEVVNQYNKEICKARLERLISLIEADDIPMDELIVVFDGDLLEGVLRASSLIKLTQPVIDSTIEVSEYLANWLVVLQERIGIPIRVAVVGGNHSVVRSLMSKPIDERENLEKIVHKIIELRLQNQPNITVEPYGDAYFVSLHKNNLLFLHGENSNLEQTMSYYENYYGVELDYVIAGHYHRGEEKTVGVGNVANKEVIRIPSICGTDDYAKKLRKNARAGATMMLFTENGKDWSKNYCLN